MVTSQMEKNGDECTDTRFLDFFFSMVPSAKSRLTLFWFFLFYRKSWCFTYLRAIIIDSSQMKYLNILFSIWPKHIFGDIHLICMSKFHQQYKTDDAFKRGVWKKRSLRYTTVHTTRTNAGDKIVTYKFRNRRFFLHMGNNKFSSNNISNKTMKNI